MTNWVVAQVKAKIFLFAYMIAAQPRRVFERMGELEIKLLDASKSMLETFHRTAEDLSQGVPWHQVKRGAANDLPARLCDYLRTFKEWKLVDERRICDR